MFNIKMVMSDWKLGGRIFYNTKVHVYVYVHKLLDVQLLEL